MQRANKVLRIGLAAGLLTVLVTFNTAVSWGQAEIDPDHYENTNDGSALAVQPSSTANRSSSNVRVPSARIRPRRTCARAVILWNNAAIEAARDNNSGSLVMLRALAVMHTAMFDALAQYDAGSHPTIGAAVRPPENDCTTENKKAISYAAHRVLADLFPSSTAKLDHVMTTFGFDPSVESQDPATSSAIGLRAAAEVLDYWQLDSFRSASAVPVLWWSASR